MSDEFFDRVERASHGSGETAAAAQQLMILHDAALSVRDCVFLELGTDRGQSTKVILHALAGTNGRLVSVDIRDCSDAGHADNWTFVQGDSADRDYVFSKADVLTKGIDFIYVDSLHTPEHVKKEVYGYFAYLKKGGKIFFDDVDPAPYMQGRRKNNVFREIQNREINDVIQDIYYNNLDRTQLTIHHGSTGLAVLTKTADFGVDLQPYKKLPRKRNSGVYRYLKKFIRRPDKKESDGSDFLIPMT